MALINIDKVYINLGCSIEPKSRPKLLLNLNLENFKIKGEIMALSLTSTQFATGTLQPVDSKGRPAKVEAGSVVFTSSDESVFVVTQDPTNELGLTITAVGEGTAQLDYSADADLGEGVVTISGFTAIEVLPALAVGFGISFSAPQEQPTSTTTTSSSTVI